MTLTAMEEERRTFIAELKAHSDAIDIQGVSDLATIAAEAYRESGMSWKSTFQEMENMFYHARTVRSVMLATSAEAGVFEIEQARDMLNKAMRKSGGAVSRATAAIARGDEQADDQADTSTAS